MKKVVIGLKAFLLFCVLNYGMILNAEDYGLGPLNTSNIYSPYLPFLHPVPESAVILEPLRLSARIKLQGANTCNLDYESTGEKFFLLIDAETWRLTLDTDIGIVKGLSLGFQTSLYYTGGGFTDSIIEGFHKAFNFSNGNREYFVNNSYNFRIEDNDGVWLALDNSTVSLSDVQLRAKVNLFDNKILALTLSPIIKLPLGSTDDFLTSGYFDYSLLMAINLNLNPFVFYINTACVSVSAPNAFYKLPLDAYYILFITSFEYRLSETASVYFQVDVNSSPYLEDNPFLGYYSGVFYLGYKNKLSDNYILEMSFSEEWWTFASSDISGIVSLCYQF